MTRKRVAVIAYCNNNLGDDLFLVLLVSRYPSVRVDIFAPTWDRVLQLSDNANVELIDAATFRERRKQYSALLILGGSMFQEIPRWHLQWAGYARRVALARLSRVPVLIMGSSFGPSSNRRFIFAYRNLFRWASSISFRDRYSVSILPKNTKAECFPDLVLARRPTEAPSLSEPGVLGVVCMDLGPKIGNALMEAVSVAQEAGWKVRLLAFQENPDYEAAVKIKNGLDVGRAVEISVYTGTNLQEFIRSFGECSAILTTRFHGMILAAVQGVPCVALNYSQKTADTVSTWRLSARVTELEDFVADVRRVVIELLNNRPVAPVNSNVREMADRHFAPLDKLLQPDRL